MAKLYIIQKGDTLSSIAHAQLGDARLAGSLADFNGLPNANQIFVGQRILLPSSRERGSPEQPDNPGAAPTAMTWPKAPHGFQAVRDVFGDILRYLRDDGSIDPRWEAERMVRAELPFAIPLAWDTSKKVRAIRCHKLIAPLLETVFRQIADAELERSIKTYGGGYVFRPKRGAVKPSTHSWGIAIDLNPNTNAMGSNGDMDPQLVDLFERHGFVWGGRWAGRNKDPMHFQYCSGY